MSFLIDNWIPIVTTLAGVIIWFIEKSKRESRKVRTSEMEAYTRAMQAHYNMFISETDEYIAENMPLDNSERYMRFQEEQENLELRSRHGGTVKQLEVIKNDLYWHRIKDIIYKSIQ